MENLLAENLVYQLLSKWPKIRINMWLYSKNNLKEVYIKEFSGILRNLYTYIVYQHNSKFLKEKKRKGK